MTTLIDRVADILAEKGGHDAVVLIAHDGEHALTYRAFFERAAAYAEALEATGLKRGDLVILVHEQGEALLCGFWAALMLGAIPSIFPFLSDKLDPDYYYSSVRQLVQRSGAAAVLTNENTRAALEGALRGIDPVITTLEAAGRARPEPYLQRRPARPGDTAFLQHSSGSTGLQKGVMLTHQAVLNQVHACGQAIDLRPDDVVVSWLPLYHDMGLIAGFILPLLSGLKLVLMSPFHWVRDPQILLRAIHRHRGTLCWQPNFAYNFLATRVRDSALDGVDLSSWRAAINCSEPVVAESHRLFLDKFRPYGFRAESLAVSYAMAENTFAVTQTALPGPPRVDAVDAHSLMVERRANPAGEGARVMEVVSCGPPIPDCEIRILDESGRTLPERQVGEIALKSTFMLDGYYRQPEISARALVDGWYITGDMGYIAAGELYVTGRKKDLIIVGGKNVYPQDIETLVNGIAGVHAGRSVAFGVYNERLGTEDVAVVAEVDVNGAEAQADISRAIRARVAQSLDVAVRYVHLVDSRWLLKTSSGKVARAANREKFLKDVLGQT